MSNRPRAGRYDAPVKLAVVIPALEEEDRIGRSVASARAPEVEVLVVDGGSRDATVERAREAGARVVVGPRGRARQLEAGRQAAAGAEAVLFLHADSQLSAGWERVVRATLADPGVAGGAFRLRFDERGARMRFLEWGARLRVSLAKLPYGDQAIFARASALAAIGGVPQAPIMEDLDLVRALRAQGRLAMLPIPVVTSARRYRARGPLRNWLRNTAALLGWRLGVDRERIAAWYAR